VPIMIEGQEFIIEISEIQNIEVIDLNGPGDVLTEIN